MARRFNRIGPGPIQPQPVKDRMGILKDVDFRYDPETFGGVVMTAHLVDSDNHSVYVGIPMGVAEQIMDEFKINGIKALNGKPVWFKEEWTGNQSVTVIGPVKM